MYLFVPFVAILMENIYRKLAIVASVCSMKNSMNSTIKSINGILRQENKHKYAVNKGDDGSVKSYIIVHLHHFE